MNELSNKVAVVTGGSSGIGRAAVELFAEEGAVVVIADIIDSDGQSVADGLAKQGLTATFIHADVSKEADVQAMFTFALSQYGRLDVLFNNAGIEGDQAMTVDSSIENWDKVLGINLRSVFLGLKYGIEAMLRNGGGAIINNASVAGLVGFPGIPAYCASKGGVVQLTRTAALEYASQGVRVNCLCPGVIDTPMVDRFTHGDAAAEKQMTAMEPLGRMGSAREVAQLALFLASDRSSFLTGAVIPVDGGFVAK
jgi:NAD(P)-dependent dehydrogenase (short-subunit alcohol dehydrogenase family)